MTPAARVAAAGDVLDAWLEGMAVERALLRWARGARYAGSKDRAAVRDHVFDAVRRRRSAAWAGGAETGRGLMLGLLRLESQDPEVVFTGDGYAPSLLTPAEQAHLDKPIDPPPDAVALDCPDWLWDRLGKDLGADRQTVLQTFQTRAPTYLRVNLLKSDLDAAVSLLAEDGISTSAHPLAETALLVTEGARRISQSRAYQTGAVELQDAASQAVVAALLPAKGRILDYCAGGGGKALALAGASNLNIDAYDAIPARLDDLAPRAKRAAANIRILRHDDALAPPYDLVVADVPCSGSGAWRRQPEAKWNLTPERLTALESLQSDILDEAALQTAKGGRLAYITCSLLSTENETQIEKFLARKSGWTCRELRRISPLAGGDGFFFSVLDRA
ncbi:MAG: RsmB/NOP family class I SAM-dependent RNA methyltransferase [Pseudomonadota bacterium]